MEVKIFSGTSLYTSRHGIIRISINSGAKRKISHYAYCPHSHFTRVSYCIWLS